MKDDLFELGLFVCVMGIAMYLLGMFKSKPKYTHIIHGRKHDEVLTKIRGVYNSGKMSDKNLIDHIRGLNNNSDVQVQMCDGIEIYKED